MHKVENFSRFLLDNGLIFEINRKILHPLGYAMVMGTDPDNVRKIIIQGLMQSDDEEGFVFDEETFQTGIEKYKEFLDKIGSKRLSVREEKLGFVIQEKDTYE